MKTTLRRTVLYYADGTTVTFEGNQDTIRHVITKLDGEYAGMAVDEAVTMDAYDLNTLKSIVRREDED